MIIKKQNKKHSYTDTHIPVAAAVVVVVGDDAANRTNHSNMDTWNNPNIKKIN